MIINLTSDAIRKGKQMFALKITWNAVVYEEEIGDVLTINPCFIEVVPIKVVGLK